MRGAAAHTRLEPRLHDGANGIRQFAFAAIDRSLSSDLRHTTVDEQLGAVDDAETGGASDVLIPA